MEKVKPKKQIPIAELLKEKRHNEVKTLLLEMLDIIKTPKTEVEYKELDVSGIESAISELNLTVDMTEIPMSIKALGDILTNKLEDLKTTLKTLERPKEWNFKIDRNNKGFIESVNAKAK